MAYYLRFEIYIPVLYTSRKDNRKHSLDERLIAEFINDITTQYHGLTQANPMAPPLYKGWWRSKESSNDQALSFVIDHLTYLFGLIAWMKPMMPAYYSHDGSNALKRILSRMSFWLFITLFKLSVNFYEGEQEEPNEINTHSAFIINYRPFLRAGIC